MLGPNEKLYPVVKIAMVVDALKDEGVSPGDALAGMLVSEAQLGSPEVRVSANEVIVILRQRTAARNAARLQTWRKSVFHGAPVRARTVWRRLVRSVP
jgi:hypothetical protein